MPVGPNTMVTNNVRLVRPLGEGGMGSVWVAEHSGLSTEVAVKFISERLIQEEPGVVERFKREAAAAAQIKSPHVVQVFDHGLMDDHRPFMVMELLEGESLSDRGARLGRLTPSEIIEIVSQVCKALTVAHELNIVHRDIKPDNIFLTTSAGELVVKVLDFGIAKQTGARGIEQLTGAEMLVGTPEYMSPEQVVSARHVDFRADLWALSVVVYQALTGGMPFAAETVGGLIVEITNSRFQPPSTWGPNVPPSVDAWFANAFAQDPAYRFGSARELATTLRHAFVGVTSLPPPPPLMSSPPPPMPPPPLMPSPAKGMTQVNGFHAPPASIAPPNTFSGSAATLGGGRTSHTGLIVAVAVIGLIVVGASALVMLRSGGGDSAARDATATQPVVTPTPTASQADGGNGPAPDTAASTEPDDDEDASDTPAPKPPAPATATAATPRPSPRKPVKPKESRKDRLGF